MKAAECSSCGKPTHRVALMLASPVQAGFCLCAECVTLMHDMVTTQRHTGESGAVKEQHGCASESATSLRCAWCNSTISPSRYAIACAGGAVCGDCVCGLAHPSNSHSVWISLNVT